MRGKHKGNHTPYIDDRNHELLKAFRRAEAELLHTNGMIRLNEALDMARLSPCSRFFVSEQRASLVIRKLILLDNYLDALSSHRDIDTSARPEDPLASMIYQRRRMFSHLFGIYKRLRSEHPDCSHEELVTMACATPADEFYLTIDSTREILSRITRKSCKK